MEINEKTTKISIRASETLYLRANDGDGKGKKEKFRPTQKRNRKLESKSDIQLEREEK